MFSKQSFPTLSSVISLQAEPGAEQTRNTFDFTVLCPSLLPAVSTEYHWLFGTCQYRKGLLVFLESKRWRQTFYRVFISNPQTFWKTVILPSNNSSKSSTKNSRNGGRLGRFRVLTSCWIFADTLLLTGTPAGQGSMETSVNGCAAPTRHQGGKERSRTARPPQLQFRAILWLKCLTSKHTSKKEQGYLMQIKPIQ